MEVQRGPRYDDGWNNNLLDNGVSIELDALFFVPLRRVTSGIQTVSLEKGKKQISVAME